MKYICGHKGCDICGARECAHTSLKHYRAHYSGRSVDLFVCDDCTIKAIKLAIDVTESFSTMIDLDKPCGNNCPLAT
jgi:hypothetical protein